MTDPHVVSLEYELETDDSTSYREPPPVELDDDAFSVRLANGVLIAVMNQHHPSVEAARAVVEAFLRAWEIDVALRYGPGELRFAFRDAVLIDRDPPPPEQSQVIHLSAAVVAKATMSATLHVARGRYPEPPRHFRVTPDVETMWQRYQHHRAGREPLLSMAYFCLTLLETRAGGRRRAALTFAIEEDVLRKLGELTSTRGDTASARKLHAQSTLSPATAGEIAWIDAVVKALIRRAGEFDSRHALRLLTMSDLPPL